MTPYIFSHYLFPQRPFWVVLKVLFHFGSPDWLQHRGSWEGSGCGPHCVLDLIAPPSAERRVLQLSAPLLAAPAHSAERLSLDGFSFWGCELRAQQVRGSKGQQLGRTPFRDRFFLFLAKCWGQLDHERARKLLPWTSQREVGKEKEI